MSDKAVITNSAMRLYRRCPKEYEHRIVNELVPLNADTEALLFGSLVHDMMEARLKGESFEAKPKDDFEAERLVRATASVNAFFNKYPLEASKFKVLATEREFRIPLRNPDSNGVSHTFVKGGKIDAILEHKDTGGIWLNEHKTSSRVDENYFLKLPMDMQICGYSNALQQEFGKQVEGVLYNVIGKCKLLRKKGESEAEFEERIWKAREQAGAKPYQQRKNETAEELEAREEARRKKAEDKIREEGQRQDETLEELGQRIAKWYEENPDVLQQREIILTKEDVAEAARIEWQTTTRIREDMSSGCFPKNPDACDRFGSMCPYFAICTSQDPTNIIKECYRKEEANKELTNGNHTANHESETSLQSQPVDNVLLRDGGSGEVQLYL